MNSIVFLSEWMLTVGVVGVLLMVGPVEAAGRRADAGTGGAIQVYIGTYTGGKSQGIYTARFDPTTGALSAPVLAAAAKNPSFLALHPSKSFLYAVAEVGDFDGGPTGAVSAFAIEPGSGALRLLNQEPSGGGGPCHLVVDRSGEHVLVANYGGGSVEVLPIGQDGVLAEPVSFMQHHGSSVNPRRQMGPHAHGVYLDAAQRFVFVPDLGLDQVVVYRYEATTGRLTASDRPGPRTAPGSGPRHLAFHPNDRFVYVINEMSSTVTVYGYDATDGVLTERETVSTLPAGYRGENSTAEIVVAPSGSFLYASNRGDDSIAVFGIESATGRLRLIDHVKTGGRTPRHFAVDPTGRFVLVANQDTDNVVVFRIGQGTGVLEPTGHSVEVGKPVCVVFAPR